MTARVDTPRARAMHDLTPKLKPSPKRGGNKGQVPVARAKGIDTGSAAGAAEIDVNKPLTDKQKAFVHSWAKGNSIKRAGLDAGFSDDSIGFRLARMPNVLALKSQLSAQYEEAAGMDRKQVMEGFKEAIEMAKLMAEPANMIAGWREIGKMCGYYAPVETKVKIDVSGSVTMTTLTAMTDAELLELIEKAPHDRTAHSQPLLSNEIDEDS